MRFNNFSVSASRNVMVCFRIHLVHAMCNAHKQLMKDLMCNANSEQWVVLCWKVHKQPDKNLYYLDKNLPRESVRIIKRGVFRQSFKISRILSILILPQLLNEKVNCFSRKAVAPNLFWCIPPFVHFGTFHSSPDTQLFFHSSPITRVCKNILSTNIFFLLPVLYLSQCSLVFKFVASINYNWNIGLYWRQ